MNPIHSDFHAVRSTVLLVTPAAAAAYLASQSGNRSVRRTNVSRMAKDMKEGRWRLNGEAIVIDETGHMIDGQHRCLACIAAETPFTTLVVTGVEREASTTLDLGSGRNLKDLTTIGSIKYESAEGHVNVHVLAAAARSFLQYQEFGEDWSMDGQRAPSAPELLEFIEANPVLVTSAAKVYRHGMIHRWMSPGQATAAHSIIATYYDVDTADLFMQEMNDGLTPTPKCPITALRRQFMETSFRRRLGSRVAVALYLKTFRRWIGEDPRAAQLRFLNKEAMPLLDMDPRSTASKALAKALEAQQQRRPYRRRSRPLDETADTLVEMIRRA